MSSWLYKSCNFCCKFKHFLNIPCSAFIALVTMHQTDFLFLTVSRKRKADSESETSPSKTTKPIRDGRTLFSDILTPALLLRLSIIPDEVPPSLILLPYSLADFCLYVGNLNNWKTSQEIKDSLAVYFMTHSLLCQEIKLDPSR